MVVEQIVNDRENVLQEQLVTFIGKNVQSLQSEDRFDELLIELRELEKWDFVLLNETWREKAEEMIELDDGHLFIGAGGTPGRSGVAVILHRRWVKSLTLFEPVCDRIMFVDCFVRGFKIRIICVYMPQCGEVGSAKKLADDHEPHLVRAKKLLEIFREESFNDAAAEVKEAIGSYQTISGGMLDGTKWHAGLKTPTGVDIATVVGFAKTTLFK